MARNKKKPTLHTSLANADATHRAHRVRGCGKRLCQFSGHKNPKRQMDLQKGRAKHLHTRNDSLLIALAWSGSAWGGIIMELKSI